MKTARILIFGLILSGLLLASCDGSGGGGGPMDTSNYHPSVRFVETWESYPVGNFPGGGWKDHPQPYYEKKIEYPNNHKMLLDGPSGPGDFGIMLPDDAAGGIYFDFKQGTMKPTFIRYKMHPYSHDPDPGDNYSSIGHFNAQGFVEDPLLYTIATSGIHISFRQYEYGKGTINVNSYQHGDAISNPLNIDNSFLIELRNIHWETNPKTFDLWINGVEVEICIPFINQISSITRIYFYNLEYGRFHMDDIFMADLHVKGKCQVVSEDPPTLPMLPPPPSPTYTREPIIFILRTPAFCRGGPGTNYPKLTTYTENTQLIITGQNLEGTWWWSEEAGCWISDVVGELQGNRNSLEVILPPPPPDTDSSEGEPGKPSGCNQGMGKDACLTNGGTWDDQPGQPGKCICP